MKNQQFYCFREGEAKMKILNFNFGATPRYTMRSSMTLKRVYYGKFDMVNRIQQEFSKSDNSTSSNQFCSFILFDRIKKLIKKEDNIQLQK